MSRIASGTAAPAPLAPLAARDYPVSVKMGVFGRKWTLLILSELSLRGSASFSDLLRTNRGMSRRVLAFRLADLRREGYIVRVTSPESPRHPTYALTAKGVDALPLVVAFSVLVRRYAEGVPGASERKGPLRELCLTHPEIGRRGPGSEESSFGPGATRSGPVGRQCVRCRRAFAASELVYVCSVQCTWCAACAERLGHLCPNCGGPLTVRAPTGPNGTITVARITLPARALPPP